MRISYGSPTANLACIPRWQFPNLPPVENVSWLLPIGARAFATTRWSVIKACNHAHELQSREALTEVCQAYWQPVYACVRHQGHSVHDAQDLTQDFFAHLLKGRYFERLDQSKGRFRAYLSMALKNFLCDQWRRRWTWQRGRGVMVVPLETQEAESGYTSCFATHITPETLYEQQWARVVVGHALEQLKIELIASQKGVLFEHFEAILTGDTLKFPYAEMARNLNTTVGALQKALHQWRRRVRTLIREEIARTVFSRSDIEEELEYLLIVLKQTR